MNKMLLRLITGLLSLVAVSAYPNGVDTCENVPGHGAWANGCTTVGCMPSPGGTALQFPYVIDVQDLATNRRVQRYTPNTTYSVILRSTNTTQGPCTPQSCFRGFVMNVGRGSLERSTFQGVSGAYMGAGELSVHPDSTLSSRTMISCPNGLTHTNNDFMRSVKAQWTSPPANTGPVTFKAIVVTGSRSLNYMAMFPMSESVNISEITPTVSRSVRPSPSANRTTSSSRSNTASITNSPSITPSMSMTASHTPTPTSSLSIGVSVSGSPSVSVSRSLSPTLLISPSHTSSASNSWTPSETDTPSSSDTPESTPSSSYVPQSPSGTLTSFPTPDRTQTSSPSLTNTPSANSTFNNFVVIQTSGPASNHAVAISLGVVGCLVLALVGLASYQQYTRRRKVYSSSRVIVLPIENVTINPNILSPALSTRNMKKSEFEPTQVRDFR